MTSNTAILVALLAFAAGAGLAAFVFIRLMSMRIRDAREQGRAELEAQLATLAERLKGRDEELLRERSHALEAGAELQSLRESIVGLRAREAELATTLIQEREHAREKVAALEELRTSFADAFKALSAEALRSNNQSFLALATANLEKYQALAKGELDQRQQAIAELVVPVKNTLEKFETQIHAVENTRASAYATLTEQVKALAESQGQLKLETANLVKALRAPHTRGRWGELQLKRVVELAGMIDHCDFYEQQSVGTEDGQLRPDLIIRLPGGKNIVVDAKAPLAAYLDALETDDEATRRRKLADHARHVKDHLLKLGRKSYQEQFQPSPDFVVLFLPGETFYSAALEADPALIEYGVEQKVILATPTTLIALLRAVAFGWKQEALAHNAQEISVLGRELYERLATLAVHWSNLGKHLGNAVGAYNDAVGALESRVLVSARKFRDLKVAPEAKELRDLVPVESTARALVAPEMETPDRPASAEVVPLPSVVSSTANVIPGPGTQEAEA